MLKLYGILYLLGVGFVICVGIGIIELCVKFKVISSF